MILRGKPPHHELLKQIGDSTAAQPERQKSVSDMPAPPQQAAAVAQPKRPERQKPDAMQERILKGDFYMD